MARKQIEKDAFTRSTTAKGANAGGIAGGIAVGIYGLAASVVPAAIFSGVVAATGILGGAWVLAGLSVLAVGGAIGALVGIAGGGIGGGILGMAWAGIKRISGNGPEQVRDREFNARLTQAEQLGRAHARQAIGAQMAMVGQDEPPQMLSSKVQDILDRGPAKGNMADAVAREKSELSAAKGLGA